MLYTEYKDLVATVLKNSQDQDPMEAVSQLIRYYYGTLYRGSESPMVFEHFYFDSLFFEVLFAIGKSEKYAEFNSGNMLKLNNIITKTILQSKIHSYRKRQNVYWRWVGGKSNYLGYDPILEYLWNTYKSMEDRNEVKRMLGLNKNIEELKKELRSLRNGSR